MPKSKYETDELGLPIGVFGDVGRVLGDGPTLCRWLFLGEAPGENEDRDGIPFVGPSGKLFNKILLEYSSLRRDEVFVTNVVKHRPPKNRTPLIGERRPYLPYLYKEIRRVNPDVIVTLGGTALWVFDRKLKITGEHGRARLGHIEDVWDGVLVPWFHPAYALRDPLALIDLYYDAKSLHEEVAKFTDIRPTFNYVLAEEEEVVDSLLRRWGTIGFDTETTSPTRGKVFQTDEAELVGYSVSQEPYSGAYVATTELGEGIKSVLGSPLWTKICHNVKFEYKILSKQGVELENVEDPALAAYLLGEPKVGLKVLSRQYLGVQPETIATVWPEGVANQPKEVAFERYRANFTYGAADADNPTRLWPIFKERLLEEDLYGVYEQIEKPLVKVLARMESRGIGVDVERAEEVGAVIGTEASRVRDSAMYIALGEGAESFNINAPDQLEKMLVGFGAPLKKRTDSDSRFSVDAESLRGIRDWWPDFVDPLLDYRKYTKFAGVVKGFVTLQGPDGRLHTSFNQVGHPEEDGTDPLVAPSTGRLSSSGPNLANIPHHRARVGEHDWGVDIRSCLVARDGMVLMSVDLAQEEPRIVAVAANDETLSEGFRHKRDIYRPATCALYTHTVVEDDDGEWAARFEDERFIGKTFFLAWYYGAGARRLLTLDKTLTRPRAETAIRMLDEAHPARESYLDYIRGELYDHAMVTSLFGRKRWFWKAWTKRTIKKGQRWPTGKNWEDAVREGANMKIQATAADILKMAMFEIDNEFTKRNMSARLVSTVYDEVVLELPESEIEQTYTLVKNAFAHKLDGIELDVEAKVGTDWGHLKAI